MFVYNRSILTVLVPLALLLAVAWWSNHSPGIVAPRLEAQEAQDRQDQQDQQDEARRELAAKHRAARVASAPANSRT